MRSIAIASLLVAFAACGSSSGPRTHQVAIRNMQFSPAEITVHPGDTIIWTNEDIFPHTVTSTAPAIFDSAKLESQQQWRYVVPAAGDYAYGCTYHPTMHGAITAR